MNSLLNKENDKIEIKLSKIKLFLMLLGALAFVVCGIWFVFVPPQQDRYGKYFLLVIGIPAIVFFGVCAVALVIKLFNNKPGLIIDDNGIMDNSGGLSNGFIAWSDIAGIEVAEEAKQKFVLIIVKNPQEYINRAKFFLSKRTRALNFKFYGTPVTISANGMRVNFETLYVILYAEYKAYLESSGITSMEEQCNIASDLVSLPKTLL